MRLASILHTWTTLGLGEREQAVLKALMNVVAGKTAAQWQHAEGLMVTLAFCQPESPMARLALGRYASHGLPHCVSVPQAGQQPLPDTRAISVRMRVGEFIALLDDISAQVRRVQTKPAATVPVSAPPATSAAPAAADGFELARLLHQMQSDPVPRARIIQVDNAWLRLYPASRRYVGSDVDVLALCRKLQAHGSALSMEPLGDQAAGRESHPLDELLWACGQAAGDALLPWIAATGRFGLHRWPDFGRLSAGSAAISLAAMMVRNTWPLSALAAQVGGDAAEVHRFINASELVGLLRTEVEAEATPVAASQAALSPERPWGGVLGKIRNALRMGRK